MGRKMQNEQVSLCETLDRILNTGVVVAGDIVISVADIDLLYIDLRCMLAAVKCISEVNEK